VKYRVPITRIGYRQTMVEIEADTPQEAITGAEDLAGSLDFPPEHTYDFEVGPAVEVPDAKLNRKQHGQAQPGDPQAGPGGHL
jgi:DNA-binding XRE family transcriptional regulator